MYSVEERVLAIAWAHERAHTGITIKDVQRDFAARFNKEANETAMATATETLHNWIRWLQQDGAPAHYALRVREFLDEVLPQRWIGRGSLHLPAAIEWPPRSPDLTSCDNSLWGIIKQKVLKQRYQTVEELKQAVREAFREITPPILRKISHRAWRRIIVCRDNDGAHTDILNQ